jgi:hypothetical protein
LFVDSFCNLFPADQRGRRSFDGFNVSFGASVVNDLSAHRALCFEIRHETATEGAQRIEARSHGNAIEFN